MPQTPRISVVTPTFNGATTLRETIESVLAQDYQNWEHIVFDGGSVDGTLDLLRSYPHLKWVSEKDQGHYHAMNKGVERSTGEIVAILNSDDCYEPGTLRKVAQAFEENPDWDALSSATSFTWMRRARKFSGEKKPVTTMTSSGSGMFVT